MVIRTENEGERFKLGRASVSTMNRSSGSSVGSDALVLGWGVGARVFGCEEK